MQFGGRGRLVGSCETVAVACCSCKLIRFGACGGGFLIGFVVRSQKHVLVAFEDGVGGGGCCSV